MVFALSKNHNRVESHGTNFGNMCFANFAHCGLPLTYYKVQAFLVHSAQLVSISAGLHGYDDHVALCRLPVELSCCSETGSVIVQLHDLYR